VVTIQFEEVASLTALVNFLSDFLNYLYNFTGMLGVANYGLAIILLTIIVKMILFPLTYKQMVSMKRMAELSPKLKEIQNKHKSQPEKVNAETMKLYKEHNINPLSGCLPLLIQMPILIGLYRALMYFNFSEAHFLWFTLTQKNDILLALLAAATTFLQSKLSGTNPNDPTYKTMLYIMPLFLGYISYTVPAGLALYWVTMNVMSILQQLFINKRIGRLNVQKA
jgi:YidC/Oxa1 family membrane protein insertase